MYSSELPLQGEEENNEAERTNSMYSAMDGASDDDTSEEDDNTTDATATATVTDDAQSDSEVDSDGDSDSQAAKNKGARHTIFKCVSGCLTAFFDGVCLAAKQWRARPRFWSGTRERASTGTIASKTSCPGKHF